MSEVNIYSPKVMVPALRESKPVHTFLVDTFFAAERTYRTEEIEIDAQVTGRTLAPFVNQYSPGKVVNRQGFDTWQVAPPTIRMKMPISAKDVSTRVMGENPYANIDPTTRAQLILGENLAKMREMIARRKEVMARDAIFNLNGNASEVHAVGDDTDLTFTFARKAALQIGTLQGTAAWTHADSDPLNQLDVWCELYARETGLVVVNVIFGTTAYRTFISNAKVKAQLQTISQIQLGQIDPKSVPNGARLVGVLYGGAVRLWTYHEWYDDPDNSNSPTEMVPAKKIMMASDRLRTEMRYGGLQALTAETPDGLPTIVEAVEWPRSWVENDPPIRMVELASRPLPVPIQNHFLTAQVQA